MKEHDFYSRDFDKSDALCEICGKLYKDHKLYDMPVILLLIP